MAKIDDDIKTNFENSRHRLIANIIHTGNWFRNTYSNFLKPFGISMQQFNILRILKGSNDWRNMNDVKSLMIDKTPNTTRLSDKLLEKELIERKRSDTDRRVVYVRITDKGLLLLENIDKKSDEIGLMDFLNNISVEEAQFSSDILDKLKE
ncbi:MarR family transcriptional regulator [Tenacibaculum sp. 190524A02b]|uniref:MarR family winged helix-turn-helix transcriptional regulator n=1 Tax=Tenacibaculum vairaonense TaxID=3137860 RepID=UPI0032B178BF